jgi:hypothetical protein
VNRVLVVALLLLVLAPAHARAQDLREFTQRFTLSWARNDAGELVGRSAPSGIAMDIDGRAVGPLKSRQAAAMLRRLFDERETISVTLLNRRELPGEPRRAWLELIWVRRARGTTIPERITVFVALVAEQDDWHITEIRLLP